MNKRSHKKKEDQINNKLGLLSRILHYSLVAVTFDEKIRTFAA
jgi:chemotaxis regulatin CheY-phosphate phosphatase CheZ